MIYLRGDLESNTQSSPSKGKSTIKLIFKNSHKIGFIYSGTSLLRSPTGLCKSDLNEEVTVLQAVICTEEYNLGLSQGDYN